MTAYGGQWHIWREMGRATFGKSKMLISISLWQKSCFVLISMYVQIAGWFSRAGDSADLL
jgi:hypothetical protein